MICLSLSQSSKIRMGFIWQLITSNFIDKICTSFAFGPQTVNRLNKSLMKTKIGIALD